MKNIVVVYLLLLPLHSIAQQTKQETENKKLVFHSVIKGGFTKGKSDASFQIQNINGVQCKTWFGGIGFGIDDYYPGSVPIFAEVKKDILNKPSTAFVYADIGSQKILTANKSMDNVGDDENFKGGLYYNFGAGYKLIVAKKISLLLNGGYSVKEYSSQYTTVYPCYAAQPCPELTSKTEYILTRFSLQLGFMF